MIELERRSGNWGRDELRATWPQPELNNNHFQPIHLIYLIFHSTHFLRFLPLFSFFFFLLLSCLLHTHTHAHIVRYISTYSIDTVEERQRQEGECSLTLFSQTFFSTYVLHVCLSRLFSFLRYTSPTFPFFDPICTYMWKKRFKTRRQTVRDIQVYT